MHRDRPCSKWSRDVKVRVVGVREKEDEEEEAEEGGEEGEERTNVALRTVRS